MYRYRHRSNNNIVIIIIISLLLLLILLLSLLLLSSSFNNLINNSSQFIRDTKVWQGRRGNPVRDLQVTFELSSIWHRTTKVRVYFLSRNLSKHGSLSMESRWNHILTFFPSGFEDVIFSEINLKSTNKNIFWWNCFMDFFWFYFIFFVSLSEVN